MNNTKDQNTAPVKVYIDSIDEIDDFDSDISQDDGTEVLGWRMYSATGTVYVRSSWFEDSGIVSVGEHEFKVSVNPSSLWATVCVVEYRSISQIDPELVELSGAGYNGRTLGDIVSDELDLELDGWKAILAGRELSLRCSYSSEDLPESLSENEFEDLYRRAVLKVVPNGVLDFIEAEDGYALDASDGSKQLKEQETDRLEFLVFEAFSSANPALRAFDWLPVSRYAHKYVFTNLVAKSRGWV